MILQQKAAPTLTKTAARFEVKALDAEARTFTGLASTWDEDLGGDVIHQGAFKRTLNAWKSSGRVLPLIDQHNYGSIRSVIGKLVSASETDAGLETTWQVIEGPDGDEALRRLKGGFIDGLSIGYEPVKWEMVRAEGDEPWEATRHLKEVKLLEVSLVIWPMNEGARVDTDSVKSLTAALKAGKLSDEQVQEIRALPEDAKNRIRALLDAAPPADSDSADAPADGLAPDDPKRLQVESLIRAVTIRGLARAP
jgi:HK97 family phage prohead protease